ncbi:MAG: hypothetical protein U0807_18745 [Candidatus Binatia bacterium]
MSAWRLAAVLALAALASGGPRVAGAWNVKCLNAQGHDCTDPYERAQTPWSSHPDNEHRALLERALALSGLPGAFADDFDVVVFTSGEELEATVLTDPLTGTSSTFRHQSIRPVRLRPHRMRTRTLSVPMMASLPDFSYTLWDWASGNERCPPDRGNDDAVDCHNYETHIGWLNSNHMVPQAERFYEHLHALALLRAAQCKRFTDAVPAAVRPRFERYLFACEKLALVIEGVAHHYLQDSWATGHMWERWGGPEIADFGNDRALGFAIAGVTGLIHGAKAVLDAHAPFSTFGPWDDPMNAPHPAVGFVMPGGTVPFAGVGDLYLPELFGQDPDGTGYRQGGDAFDAQRGALLGCAVDGLRTVYDATAKLHGPLRAASTSGIDDFRHVADPSCWSQRATNRAIAEGCGIHRGAYPNQSPIDLSNGVSGYLLLVAETELIPTLAGAPVLTGDRLDQFRADVAYACTLAKAVAADPTQADGTYLAAGRLPAVLGIAPGGAYARGGAASPGQLPASFADPFLPWNLDAPDPALQERTQTLNLAFADAHAADRCSELAEGNLEAYRDAVRDAVDARDVALTAVRIAQCVQMATPHLRFGVDGDHDLRREAFCAYVAPASARFVYTGEDPASFTGSEPTDLPSVEAAVGEWCTASPSTTTTTTPISSTTTTMPGPPFVVTTSCTRSVRVNNGPFRDASVAVVAEGGKGPYTVSFDATPGLQTSTSSMSVGGSLRSEDPDGSYTLTATIGDGRGHSGTRSATVTKLNGVFSFENCDSVSDITFVGPGG